MILGCLVEVPYPTATPTVRAVYEPEPTSPRPPRLLDRVRIALRARHGSRHTEKAYVGPGTQEIDLPSRRCRARQALGAPSCRPDPRGSPRCHPRVTAPHG